MVSGGRNANMIMHISAMSNSGFGSEDSHTMAVVFVTFLCVWVCEAVCVCVSTAGALEVITVKGVSSGYYPPTHPVQHFAPVPKKQYSHYQSGALTTKQYVGK